MFPVTHHALTFTHSPPHSHTPPLTHSLPPPLTHPLLKCKVSRSASLKPVTITLQCSPSHITRSLPHSFTHPLTHSFTHSPTHSLTHPLLKSKVSGPASLKPVTIILRCSPSHVTASILPSSTVKIFTL